MSVSAVALAVKQMGTPANPAAGESLIYPKSDGLWYTKAGTGGAETLVGGTSQANTGSTLPGSSGTNITVNSTTPVDIPGLTKTVTSAGVGSSWLVTYSGWHVVGNAAYTLIAACVANGVTQPGAVVLSNASINATMSGIWYVTGLAAGSRVIKIQASMAGAGQSAVIAGSSNAWMNVVQLT